MYVSNSSVEKSYDLLKALDINKDGKVTGQEIQFVDTLNQVKANPTPENIKKANDLIDKITKDPSQKSEFKQNLLLTVMSAKCSDPPKVSELNDILKIMPGKDKNDWARTILSLTPETKEMDAKDVNGVLEFEALDELSNHIQYDQKKGEFQLKPDKSIPSFKAKFDQLNTTLDLGKDVLDGDTAIKGVDKSVIENFLGKKDATNLNTYKSADFDPDKFVTFDVKIRKHTIKYGDQEIYIDRSSSQSEKANFTDPATGKVTQVEPAELRKKITENYPEFKKFAEDNHLFNDKGELDNAKLSTVKKFVDTIPDVDKKMNFVANFMSAYYVHSGEGVDQKNVNEDNFTDILSSPQMLKANDGRTILDCQFFAAVAQNLLGVSKGKNGGLEAKDIVLSTSEDKDGKKNVAGLHQVTLLKDSGSGKFFIQSNDQIREIKKEQLKLTGWDEKKGPPTDEQLIKAANYTPPKNKNGEKGLLGEQFSNGAKFNNYSLVEDPLNNIIMPKGQTKVEDLAGGGVKTKDAKGNIYYFTAEGKRLPEKAGKHTFPDGTEGEVTITGAGSNSFTGKVKDKQGKDHNIKIYWDKDGKGNVEKSD